MPTSLSIPSSSFWCGAGSGVFGRRRAESTSDPRPIAAHRGRAGGMDCLKRISFSLFGAVAEWSKAVNKHSPTLLTIRPMPCSLSLPSMILMSPPSFHLLFCAADGRRRDRGPRGRGFARLTESKVDVGTRGKPPLSNPSTSVRALSAGGRGERRDSLGLRRRISLSLSLSCRVLFSFPLM